jgi:RNA polymerase sigma-70 factor (ECF subfamily)
VEDRSRDADAKSVRCAALGDRAAFGALVRRYQRPLVNFAYRYLGQREEAEDVAQDAFVRVYFTLSRLRDPSKFAAYLFTTALNLCRRRGQALQRTQGATTACVEAIAAGPETATMRESEQAQVLAAIGALAEEYREVVCLRVEDDLSFAEIGEVLGASEGACRVRFHRAREMLREQLTTAGAADEEKA